MGKEMDILLLRPTKTGKLLECGAELKTQVPPQGFKIGSATTSHKDMPDHLHWVRPGSTPSQSLLQPRLLPQAL